MIMSVFTGVILQLGVVQFSKNFLFQNGKQSQKNYDFIYA